MAGEWIKFECSLPEKPETLAIAAAMGWTDPDLAVGKLMRLFRWFDQQTVDGNAARVTPALLDQVLGVTGLTLAVASVGWLTVSEGGVSLAKFDRHNGESAKQRAQTAKRVAKHKGNAKANDEGNAAGVSSALPREEKRREEIEDTPQPPQAGAAGAVCKAIRSKGVMDVSPSHPELLALIAKGVTVETFEAAATTCANSKPPKGIGYLLAIVKRQLSEAASIAAGPAAAEVDPDSMQAVIAEGVANGVGAWDQIEQWPVYKARVRGTKQPGLSLGDLSGMAQQRLGAH